MSLNASDDLERPASEKSVPSDVLQRPASEKSDASDDVQAC